MLKLLGTIGDINPIDHGGGFVVQSENTDRIQLVYVDPSGKDEYGDPTGWTVYRTDIDRTQRVDGFLVPAAYRSAWPHPVADYEEWFAKDLLDIGGPYIVDVLCGDDAVARAGAYCLIANHHGWMNFDEYPLTFQSRAEIEDYVETLRG